MKIKIQKIIIITTICLLITSSFSTSYAFQNYKNKDSNQYISINGTNNEIVATCYFFNPDDVTSKDIIISYEKGLNLVKLFKESNDNPLKRTELINTLNDLGFINNKSFNLKKPEWIDIIKPFKSSTTGTSFFCSIASAGSGKTTPIVLLPRPRGILSWNGYEDPQFAITTVGSLSKNKGFIARGSQHGTAIGFVGLGITFGTPYDTIYAFIGYALYTSVTADDIDFYPPNSKPVVSNPIPSNNQENIPTTLAELSFQIHDDDNELMDYSVTTEPYIGSGSKNNVINGIYSISISGLQPSTTYTWTVNVTDGQDRTTNIFSFMTVQERPIITNPIPIDGSSTSTDLSELSFALTDAQGDKMNYTIQTSPDIGNDSATGIGNGIYTMPINGLEENNWYYWYVNVTDGEHWTKEKFSFYTGGLALVGYWNFDEGSGTIVHDISGNGYDGNNVGCSWVTGKTGYGLEITDKTDRVESISSSYDNLISTAFTISAWVKWSGVVEKSNGIIFDGRTTYNRGGFVLYVSDNGQLCFHINQGTTDEVYVIRSKSNIPSGKWTLVTAVFNDNSDSWSLYINSLEDISQSITYHYIKSPDKASIGNNHWAPNDGVWRPFYGIIDELRIYNNSLSESQIINIYNQRLSNISNN